MSQIQEIFAAALEITDEAERAAMLDRACAHAPELRARVCALLKVQPEADQFFSNCLPPNAKSDGHLVTRRTEVSELADAPPETKGGPEGIGARIGRYKLLQEIGEGGCGVVYMAEQEKPVRRRVALKIIKLGMDTKSVIARFESERQALALMDHPNIARVLDGGATETGRPYFVMELIHGVGLLDYCDENHLDTRRRLELFVQVCHAIQHAHQKGIVHRDIKPSNILVTLHDGVPVPKVIDFGIAKAMTQPLTDKTLFTGYGCFIGTPTYMSPEQAEFSGLDVDTRSDIYSLGVVLYELLTSKPPFDQQDLLAAGLDEMRRTLREREPHRPSTKLETLTPAELTATAVRRHVETRKLQLLLKGDLDWIVMKALEKDRQRRYETANGLSMDIQRFLNNEPVVARPPSRWYRFQKLAQRNRVTFAAVGAVTLALLAGIGTSTWLYVKERQMRRRAAAAEQQAEQARENETRFRREAEARANIAQAAILISRDKLAEAEQCVERLQVPVTEPSLEAAGVFRTLGDRAAAQGRWPQAVEHFRRLSIADEVDKSEVTDLTSWDSLRLGPSLIAAGDLPGFHQFVRERIARFNAATNLIAAEQVIKACLVGPAEPRDVLALDPLARVIAQSLEGAGQREAGRMVAWREFALSLYVYRLGAYADAAAWQRKCLASPDTLLERQAMGHVVLAMSLHHLGQPKEATAELEAGRELIRLNCPESERAISVSDMSRDSAIYWFDWVIAQILEREASAFIPTPSSS